MSNVKLRFLKKTQLVPDENCVESWTVKKLSPLEYLANTENDSSDIGFQYFCRKHKIKFPLTGDCPILSREMIKADIGEILSLPAEQAKWIVENKYAELIIENSNKDNACDNKISKEKINKLINSSGLSNILIDDESLSVIAKPTSKSQSRLRTPAAKNLAEEFGISIDELAEMKKLGASKKQV